MKRHRDGTAKPIAGIDPGLTGAVAILHDNDELHVHDMPVADGHVNGNELAHLLAGVRLVVVERQQPMRRRGVRQGVSSTFKTGQNYGIIIGVLSALAVPFHVVSPASWKRAMRLPADKEAVRLRAIARFPAIAGCLKRKKDHGRAEAAFLALYAREYLK